MKEKFIFILFIFAFILIISNTSAATNVNYTYTTDEDFNSGNITGLNVSDDQIQLSDNSSSSAFPFIWVPNSNEGTVSKVNTLTGLEVARYRVSPSTGSSPSRTTIDLDGSCWVCNRETGTVVKIGLFENGIYFDRNNNGIIETSRDIDGNGMIMNTKDPITGADIIELLPWGTDECVLWEVVVIPGCEDTYRPGNYTGGYSSAPGPRGIAVDSQNNIWAGTYGTGRFYYINGIDGQILKTINVSSAGHGSYGAVIDQYGILWSSGGSGNNILRLDPSDGSFRRINVPHTSYGLGLDRNNHIFVSGYDYFRFSRINILTGTIEWTKKCPIESRGIAITDDGDVWIANSRAGTVTRYTNNGDFKATIIVGNVPTGVSVDNNGKIWVVDNNDEYIHRINPDNDQMDSNGNIINGVELSKRIVGGTHYGYSDMTGVISNTITTNRGFWDIIHDSEVDNALWGVISWNSFEPQDTRITVRARSSNDKVSWSAWENVTNGTLLSSTPRGRFLEIETTFERFKGSISPILYDLNVRALSADIILTNLIDNPTPKVGDTVRFITMVSNDGPDPATNLRVYPVIPTGFIPETPTRGFFENNVWVVGNLNPGEVAILEVKGNVTSELTSRNIIYTANEIHEEYDPTQVSTSSASFYVPVSNIELITGTQNGRPTLFVRNNGPDHAFNVGVQTTLPFSSTSNTSQGFYSNGLWYVGALASGATVSLNLIFPAQNVDTSTIPGYKRVLVNGKYVYVRDYSGQRGNIPPPEDSVPMQDTGVPINFSGIAILFIFFAVYLNKNDNKLRPNKWLALFIILFFALLLVGNVSAADPNQTYTSSNDFNNGIYNNMDGSEGQLELSNSTNPANNYIWVPNTNQGMISKVDIRTGQEVARYRTSPLSNANPSRTVIDSSGNCWVANYQAGTVVKIGLLENGGYIDRNLDGIIQTSQDLDHNGVITGTEILDWGKDECVLYETIFIPGREGNYTPGQYTGGYANDWRNPGPLAIVLDNDNNVWVGCYGLYKYFCLDDASGQILKTIDVYSVRHTPFGAVIDQNGIIWSVAGQNKNILRLDTTTGSFTRLNISHWAYGLALDGNNHLFVTGYTDRRISRVNTLTGTVEWTKTASNGARGVVVTADGDVWTANLESDTVTRFSNDGILKATIWAGNGPSALSVDNEGNIWAVDYEDVYIHRINPAINGVDFSKLIFQGTHYAYSNMFPPNSNTYDRGTWTVIHDSLVDNAYWGTVSWNSFEPKGTRVSARVRSSNDKINWSEWEEAFNGANLRLTPPGKYLEAEFALERTGGLYSPVVYDLTIRNLDPNASAADLGVTITGDRSSLNQGETVKLTVKAFNNGSKSADVSVDYKIPFGLKLLSSQGQGVYDSDLSVWSVGVLDAGGDATIELVLQAENSGSYINNAVIYSDSPDLNISNNQAGFNLVVNTSNLQDIPLDDFNTLPYVFPPDIKPPNPLPPYNPPIPPGPTPQSPFPPGPGPNPGPSGPKTQLELDITGVRDAISEGVENIIPDWTGDPEPEPTQEEYEGWVKTMLKFSVEVAILAFIEFTPTGGSASGEYLQGVKSAFLNNFKVLNTIGKYFGNNKYVKYLQEASKAIKESPTIEKALKGWDGLMSTFGFNYGMSVFKRGLYKLFPGQEAKINALLLTYSSAQFIRDPAGTINAIIDIITSLMKGQLPDRESFEKVFIFDPAQDK